MEAILKNLKGVAALAHKSVPYLLLEILLPGGTLVALLLFLHRRRSLSGGRESGHGAVSVVEQTIAGVRSALVVVQPYDIAAVAAADAANEEDGLAPLAMAPGR